MRRLKPLIWKLKRIVQRTLGYRETSTYGSNQRRANSRVTLWVSMLLAVDLVCAELGFPLFGIYLIAGVAMVLWATFFFLLTVIWAVFLSSQKYQPDPARLIQDLMVSVLISLFGFSFLYRTVGIVETVASNDSFVSPLDHLYFSAVTFSTLGYGDFRPIEEVRLVASLQAILGNLHLGFFVGASFYALQFQPRD